VTVPAKSAQRFRPNFVLRSVLVATALMLLFLPAAAVVGAYLPQVRPLAGFGRLLNTDLPWIVLGAAVALGLSLVALRINGKWLSSIVAIASSVVLLGSIVVGAQFFTVAASHGATYDLLRQAQAPRPPTRWPDEAIVFAEVDGQPLRAEIWRPAAPTGAAVVWIHGGGFTHGVPGMRPYLHGFLVNAGYLVFDIEYRLAPPPRWEDAPADALCGLGWLQREAAGYGVDPSRIVVMGDSAGGNLAMVAGYAPGLAADSQELTPSCDVDPAPPAGVVAMYPVADLAATWRDLRAQGGEVPFPEVYVGGTPDEYPERYTAASVQRFIRPELPPTLIYTGTQDQLILIERVRDVADDLRAAGVDVELVEVPFTDHAFDGFANGFGAQLEETLFLDFLARVT
jgi:acetyl esterase/lipase